jgi:hypothetical protein
MKDDFLGLAPWLRLNYLHAGPDIQRDLRPEDGLAETDLSPCNADAISRGQGV